MTTPRWTTWQTRLVLFVLIGCGGGRLLVGDEPPAAEAAVSNQPPVTQVLGRLGGRPILRSELDLLLGRRGDAGLPDQPLSWTAEQAGLELLAMQQQALQTLRTLKLAATSEEVDDWLNAQPAEPAIEQTPASEDEFYKELIAFRLSWQRYLAQHLTRSNVARHFDNQTARFDGTRFQLDRLSVAVPAGSSAARRQAANQLEATRTQVLADPMRVWGLPANSDLHSTSSMASWVRGSGDLDPRLISPLLEMQPGDISPVVHTASGVHLLRLLAVEPGQLKLGAVEGEVRSHMLLYLLEHLAQQSAELLPLVAEPHN